MASNIRFRLPVSLRLDGFTFEQFTVTFELRGFSVEVRLHAAPPDRGPFDADVVSVDFRAERREPARAEAAQPEELLDLVTRCCNRVLSALRNAALMPSAKPFRAEWLRSFGPESLLSEFNVESFDSHTSEWKPIFEPTFENLLTARMLFRDMGRVEGTLRSIMLTDVLERIESGTAPTPDEEFYVNALEHLDAGNLRMAVIEAVISIELCVNEWINRWLAARGVPADAIRDHFGKDVGLTTRVAVMVPLMLHGNPFRVPFDQTAVIRLIRLRNAIAHRSGRIEGVGENDIRTFIGEGMKLALRAARERDVMDAQPRIAVLRDAIEQKWGARPKIHLSPPRAYFVTLMLPSVVPRPDEDESLRVIDDIIDRLAEGDRWFNRVDHADVHLAQNNRAVAEFSEGRFTWYPPPSS